MENCKSEIEIFIKEESKNQSVKTTSSKRRKSYMSMENLLEQEDEA